MFLSVSTVSAVSSPAVSFSQRRYHQHGEPPRRIVLGSNLPDYEFASQVKRFVKAHKYRLRKEEARREARHLGPSEDGQRQFIKTKAITKARKRAARKAELAALGIPARSPRTSYSYHGDSFVQSY